MPTRARDGVRGAAVVAGQHDDPDALARGARRWLRPRVSLIGSATTSSPASLPSIATNITPCALAAMLIGLGLERGRVDAELAQQRRVAERHLPAVDRARDALAGVRLRNRCVAGSVDAALLGALDDRRRERMLAAALERWRRGAAPRLVEPVGRLHVNRASACRRSACRSCRRRACRSSPSARAPRRS